MRNKFIYILMLIFPLLLILPQCELLSGNQEAGKPSNVINVDLSTPEKTILLFHEAFRIGNDKLLDEVLTPGAYIPEFNALQKIVRPSPHIIGAEIKKINVIKEGKIYPDSGFGIFEIKPNDVEVYVEVKYDMSLYKQPDKIYEDVMLGRRSIYLLRKFDGKWKIMSSVPFWPEDYKDLRNK